MRHQFLKEMSGLYFKPLGSEWKIPKLQIYVNKFDAYPSKTTFNRVLKKSTILSFFKEKNDIGNKGDDIEDYMESSSPIVKEDPNIYTSSFFFTVPNKDMAVHVKIRGYNDHFSTTVTEEDEEHLKQFDGFDYEVDIYFNPKGMSKSTVVKNYIKPLRKLGTERQKKQKLSIVSRDRDGFYLASFEVKEPKIDFDLNYNKDFKKVDTKLKKRLQEENGKGIALLHGPPGTGKTMYIRHLINNIEKDHIIYLPPDLVDVISNPEFATFLLEFPNSLLIVEDAETAIRERKDHTSQSVSNLLNMADGLLSDALRMQILATFNSEIQSIDEALLRRGRLIAKHEFGPLTVKRAQKLSDTLGFDREITKPEPLSSIYNPGEKDEQAKQKQENNNTVGFTP